jgi:hypothetical protein
MPFAELVALATKRRDDEIIKDVEAAGVETTLDRVFAAMVKGFQPDRAGSTTATVQWDVTAPDGKYSYHMTIDAGTCTFSRGPAERPRATLGLSLPDFLRFIAGELKTMKAFMTRRLHVKGDLPFAQAHEKFFVRG